MREEIAQALFAKLTAATFATPIRGKTTFQKTSRRVRLWTEVPREDRPSLMMMCHSESPRWSNELAPPYTEFDFEVFVYLDASGESYVADTDINIVLDALYAALKPPPHQRKQILNGLVSHARIEGQILRVPGDLDGDGLIVVPIKVTTDAEYP